jgi:ABC-2 type transport system permease protein
MKYSQLRAMLSITVASLRAISRSPSAIVFSFVFPFILIIVFGFIGNSGKQTFRIVMDKASDTANVLYQTLKGSENIRIMNFENEQQLNENLDRGRIAGIVKITKNDSGAVPYEVSITSTTSSNDKWPQLKALIESQINQISNNMYASRPAYAKLDFDYTRDIAEIRQYKTIDFILPGMLGFSLMSAGVFGVAFMFFHLRNTLVLKRFFATPVSKTGIVLGEGISRVIFQMITAVVIILAGYYFFDFTLVHGWITFVEMLFLSLVGLLIFMGFGFIVSGLANTDSSIPPFANLITMPQFLLGGTFFSVEVLPKWLQPIPNIMPLTHLNNAMRSIAFEGLNLWDVRMEIGILLLWGIVVYAIAIRVFRWE